MFRMNLSTGGGAGKTPSAFIEGEEIVKTFFEELGVNLAKLSPDEVQAFLAMLKQAIHEWLESMFAEVQELVEKHNQLLAQLANLDPSNAGIGG